MNEALSSIACGILLVVQNALSQPQPTSNIADVTALSHAQLGHLVESQHATITAQQTTISTQDERIAALTHQLDWFRRQLFGQKSERLPEANPAQLHLGEVAPIPGVVPEKVKTIRAHTRRVAQKDSAEGAEELPFFDESSVPAETIILVHEQAQELKSGEFVLIGEKISHSRTARNAGYRRNASNAS